MSASKRLLPSRLSLLRSASSSPSRNFTSTTRLAVQGEPWPQRSPLGAYYESIIRDPTPYPFKEKPEDPPDSADPDVQPPGKKPESPSAPPPTKKKPGRKPAASASASLPASSDLSAASTPIPSPPPMTAAEKARIVFGSRLLGPAEQADRLAAKKAQSTYIAGVLVPPRPEEPDNCCMSGCVNCVWDRFRDDMEEWSARKNEAQMRLNDKEASIDADGGGSQGGWGVRLGNAKIAKDLWDEEVFENVPVGIREFMKQEKRLKEKHQREGTMGG
ncbi:Oxidoreductase-like protein [Hirsutella rhossiliensis]